MAPVIVTVLMAGPLAGFWKTATPFCHTLLAVPVALVKLVFEALHVPEPPTTEEVGVIAAPSQYCVSTPASIAPKPALLSHAEAATVPIGALTAWQGLVDRAKLQATERILIHGGSGAVGVFAIQIARRAGAHVITTASARNFDFLAKLGANEVIDYRTHRFEEKVQPVDVVFDSIGGETLNRSWSLLKPNGRMVTIASASEGNKDERIEKAFFIVEPNRKHLSEIALLFGAGLLQCFVDAVVPLAKASDAYSGSIPERRGRGKVVLSIVN